MLAAKGSLEAVVAALDLAHRLTIKPEHDASKLYSLYTFSAMYFLSADERWNRLRNFGFTSRVKAAS